MYVLSVTVKNDCSSTDEVTVKAIGGWADVLKFALHLVLECYELTAAIVEFEYELSGGDGGESAPADPG